MGGGGHCSVRCCESGSYSGRSVKKGYICEAVLVGRSPRGETREEWDGITCGVWGVWAMREEERRTTITEAGVCEQSSGKGKIAGCRLRLCSRGHGVAVLI